MRPHDAVRCALALVLLLAGISLSRRREFSSRELWLETHGCRVPVSVLNADAPPTQAAAVVFHGLSSNRRLMRLFGEDLAAARLRVFLADLPGHGDNTQPFTPAFAETCATNLVLELRDRGEILPARTVLVGHSMGGSIAIRMAQHFPAAATVALSPAPMTVADRTPPEMILFPPPERRPANLLIFLGGLEPGLGLKADRALVEFAGGERFAPEDFALGRAAHLSIVPGATHTSVLFDPRAGRESLRWIQQAVPGYTTLPEPNRSALLGGFLGLLGWIVLFPVFAEIAGRRWGSGEALSPAMAPGGVRRVVLLVAMASAAAVVMLRFVVPLQLLRILTGDYLASFLLFVGMVLLIVYWAQAKVALSCRTGALAVAALLGMVTVFFMGAWLNWRLTDAWMNMARWARFLPLILVCLPFSAAEEVLLGPPRTSGRVRRWMQFAAMRSLLWLALMFGLFFLHSGQILLLLLVVFFAAFCLLQRLGSDSVRRRTGSAAAAALFSAILAAWFLAAVLPLT